MATTTHAARTKATSSPATRPARPAQRTGRAPRDFPLFSNLPAEIRLAIWRCTFPGPRVVALRPRQTTVLRPGAAPRYVPWYTSPARLPEALHACREARAECLATYPVLFDGGGGGGGVVFSPARDVLYLGGRGATARLRIQGFLGAAAMAGDLARVRRAAVHAAALWDERLGPALAAAGAAACLGALAATMPALNHLAIVRGDLDPLYNSADVALVEILILGDDRAPSCADRVLLHNVHKALGLLPRDDDDDDDDDTDTDTAPFPAWELMDMAVVPPYHLSGCDAACGPNHGRQPGGSMARRLDEEDQTHEVTGLWPPSRAVETTDIPADEATGTVFAPPEEEEDEGDGLWTLVELHGAEPWAGLVV